MEFDRGIRTRSIRMSSWAATFSYLVLEAGRRAHAIGELKPQLSGTARQKTHVRAEGDYEDFARSGMQDFISFTRQDLRAF